MAVALLREHARVFLPAAAVLAAVEQGLLYGLRSAAGIADAPFIPYVDQVWHVWVLFATGLGTETMIIALLGGLTARAAGPALLGRPVTTRHLLAPGDGRYLAVAAVAPLVGLAGAVAAVAGFLPWIFVYGLVALVAPVIVTERVGPGRALSRSVALSAQRGLRAVWIRLGGYAGWVAIRIALTLGCAALAERLFQGAGPLWGESGTTTIAVAVFAVPINAVAYATLACLDSALYLETRMRVEGLDITVGRALHHGKRPSLAVRE